MTTSEISFDIKTQWYSEKDGDTSKMSLVMMILQVYCQHADIEQVNKIQTCHHSRGRSKSAPVWKQHVVQQINTYTFSVAMYVIVPSRLLFLR